MEKGGLTELQRKTLEKRLAALKADYPIKGLKLVMADGERVTWGELPAEAMPQAPKKPKRQYLGDFALGELSRKCIPWIELAYESKGELIKIRKDDFPGVDLERISRCMSGYAVNHYGRGTFSIRKVADDTDGFAYIIKALETPLVGVKRG